MHKRIIFCLASLIGITVNAQTINLQGIVSNSAGQPIANAIVTLERQGMMDTTGTDGKFSMTQTVAIQLPALIPSAEEISMNNGIVQFTLKNSSPVKVELFDVKGNLLKKEIMNSAAAGVYRFDIAKNCRASNLLIIKAAIGNREVSFRYMTLNKGSYSLNQSGASTASNGGRLAQLAAVLDTIKVTATGYTTKLVAITTYDNQQQNISLDSASASSPDTGRSIGCGKSLGSLKTGTYTITSAGLNREYIINIPTNYNPNKPLRLIFAMHCMCGSMWSVQSENFYELKRCADSANVQCIYVAPSVYNGGNYNESTWGCPVWDQGVKDHTFFDDMLALFKSELCVDTTRVFSVGFSYGAMFTNSLAQNHQKVLRAVVCYETSFGGGIYLPTKLKLPIAWMGVVGMSDTRCPPSDGRACRDTILKNNALNGVVTTEKATETTVGSKTHVIYDYKGVDPRYPVKWCTADCDHQWSEYDGGAIGSYDPAKSWTPEVAWHFISQF